jgi:hypothetical protein
LGFVYWSFRRAAATKSKEPVSRNAAGFVASVKRKLQKMLRFVCPPHQSQGSRGRGGGSSPPRLSLPAYCRVQKPKPNLDFSSFPDPPLARRAPLARTAGSRWSNATVLSIGF